MDIYDHLDSCLHMGFSQIKQHSILMLRCWPYLLWGSWWSDFLSADSTPASFETPTTEKFRLTTPAPDDGEKEAAAAKEKIDKGNKSR